MNFYELYKKLLRGHRNIVKYLLDHFINYNVLYVETVLHVKTKIKALQLTLILPYEEEAFLFLLYFYQPSLIQRLLLLQFSLSLRLQFELRSLMSISGKKKIHLLTATVFDMYNEQCCQ